MRGLLEGVLIRWKSDWFLLLLGFLCYIALEARVYLYWRSSSVTIYDH